MDIDPGMKAVLLAPQVQLDLGGIVKGWAVRRLAEWMKREGKIARGLVNAGGDLMAWGRHDGQPQPWGIAIENPWRPDEDIGLLQLACGAAATSSRLGRAWQTDQGRMHHLIDPRTMRPSRSDTVQCTVTGPDPIVCDVWAKTICILGSEEGAALLKRQAPAYEAAIFTEDERVLFCGSRESLGTTWIDLPAEPEDDHHIWTERLGTAWWNGLQDCPSGK
jgi:thiamine biosynthesis lipoprotein